MLVLMILIRIVFEMCFVLFMSEVLAIKFKTTIKSLDTLCLEEFISRDVMM